MYDTKAINAYLYMVSLLFQDSIPESARLNLVLAKQSMKGMWHQIKLAMLKYDCNKYLKIPRTSLLFLTFLYQLQTRKDRSGMRTFPAVYQNFINPYFI